MARNIIILLTVRKTRGAIYFESKNDDLGIALVMFED